VSTEAERHDDLPETLPWLQKIEDEPDRKGPGGALTALGAIALALVVIAALWVFWGGYAPGDGDAPADAPPPPAAASAEPPVAAQPKTKPKRAAATPARKAAPAAPAKRSHASAAPATPKPSAKVAPKPQRAAPARAASAGAESRSGGQRVQVGAFSTRAAADRFASRLRARSAALQPRVSPVKRGGRTLYRVAVKGRSAGPVCRTLRLTGCFQARR
jgi:outer membrane biosynthesis protein TonB